MVNPRNKVLVNAGIDASSFFLYIVIATVAWWTLHPAVYSIVQSNTEPNETASYLPLHLLSSTSQTPIQLTTSIHLPTPFLQGCFQLWGSPSPDAPCFCLSLSLLTSGYASLGSGQTLVFLLPPSRLAAKAVRQWRGGGCALSSEERDKIGQLREKRSGSLPKFKELYWVMQ